LLALERGDLVVDGERLNWFTGGLRYGLSGAPDRRTELWRIVTSPFNAARRHAEGGLDHWY
jgi:hypothetical protein